MHLPLDNPETFKGDLVVRIVSSKFELLIPFYSKYSRHKDGHSPYFIEVPAGFITDFASIPKFLLGLFPPNERLNKACLVHDYLYSNKSWFPLSRKDADRGLKQDLLYYNFAKWRVYSIYYGVRFFGIFKYKNDGY